MLINNFNTSWVSFVNWPTLLSISCATRETFMSFSFCVKLVHDLLCSEMLRKLRLHRAEK